MILTATDLTAGRFEAFTDDIPEKINFTRDERDWIKKNPVITVGVDTEFAPIEYLDKNNRYVGVTADFLTLVTRRTGLVFKIDHKHSWKESIESVKTGKIHMLGAAVPSKQRKQYMDFTQSYASLSGIIIVKKSVTEPMSLEKLEGMEVAVVQDYIWRDILETYHPKLEINPSPDIQTTLKKVSFGMTDAMVGYLATASHYIEQLGISNLKVSGETVSVMDISFAVAQKHPQLKNILNRVLEQTTPAQKNSILRKWISLELNKPADLKRVSRILLPWIFLGLSIFIGIAIWNRSLHKKVNQRTKKLNRELAQRKQAEQALRESEEKYRSIFGNIQDVYFEIQPEGQGRILEISPSVEKVIGYKREPMLHSLLSRIFVDHNNFKEMLIKTIREERLVNHETILTRPGGKTLTCFMNAMVIKNAQGTPMKIVGSIRNISDHVKAQKQLRKAYRELEERVRERTAELRNTNKELNKAKEAADKATLAKSNFLANMSHEIRTPLSGVISASELVMNESPPQKIARYINIIRTSAHALLEIIDDILDFSKIEAGKMDIEIHSFHFNQLISRATNLFRHRLTEKEITFVTDIKPDTPVHLMGDSFRIQQILTNLISNAIKFTDKGGRITLGVSATPCDNEPETVRMKFLVADTGIGISPEHQDLLFTPFSQVDASTTRKYGGSGLGLSICGQLVEMMNGTISVESHPQKGSCFQFNIPLKVLEKKEMDQMTPPSLLNQPQSISTYRTFLEGRKILVAEDTPTNQEIILAILELAGIETILADTGTKALEKVQQQEFDAVLMDIQMPEMDGFETTRAIRMQKDKSRLPIIAMTAHALKEDKNKCIAAGMNGYISKPVNQEKLFKTLIKLIHGESTDLPVEQETTAVKNAGNPTEFTGSLPKQVRGIDVEKAINAIGIDEGTFIQVLQTFFKSYEHIAEHIKSAWLNRDREEVITQLHTLKGSAGGIGATELHRRVLELEKFCKDTSGLPAMEKAGLASLENALDTVLASIEFIMSQQQAPQKETPGVRVDLVKAGAVLTRLEQALKFPEIEELETLMEELESVFEHPVIMELKNHIFSHDHELAEDSVANLQTILEGLSL
ncbi:MAG: transporter substrate-binding domain-containing protein [Desulfobacteraceae bacterium]|nr:transporter substrate-binding domain-containing protein [Desulfobacteraceae bacterium]